MLLKQDRCLRAATTIFKAAFPGGQECKQGKGAHPRGASTARARDGRERSRKEPPLPRQLLTAPASLGPNPGLGQTDAHKLGELHGN